MRYPDYANIPFTVFDAETSIKNRGEDAIGKNKASPHHPENKIVWYGSTTPQKFLECVNSNYWPMRWASSEFKTNKDCGEFVMCMQSAKLLVGHNLKFDLLHLMSDPELREMILAWLRSGGFIWDTMIVEYLLTGQESQFISLDALSMQNGGHVKDDRLKKDYWDKNIDTEDIPVEIIMPYLVGDLANTANNFMHQLQKIDSMKDEQHISEFLTLVASQMEALLATTMIEHNGIHFDILGASNAAATLAAEHETLTEQLAHEMALQFNIIARPPMSLKDCNPASTQQLSAMLAGGKVKHTKKDFIRDEHGKKVKIKSGPNKGQYKMKNFEYEVDIVGIFQNLPHHLESTAHGYKLDESALKNLIKLADEHARPAAKKFIEDLLRWRSLQKELTTSYIGLLELVWPPDSCIHGNLNHCATGTGRLSSSAPNQQNFSSKEVKE